MSADGRRGFVGVDRHWLNDPDLSDRDLRLMLWLDSHTDEYLGQLNISTVASQIGWARNKVKRALEQLVLLELISSELLPTKGGGTRTRITLHQSRWSDRDHRDGPQRTSAMVHDEPATVVHDDATTTSNPSIEKSSSSNPQTPATTEVVSGFERVFDSFWQAYPRKVGKPMALKSFRAATKKHGVEEVARGFHAWREFWHLDSTDLQFIPHPSTWLNQERYMDSPPPIVAPPTKSSASMDAIRRLAERDSL